MNKYKILPLKKPVFATLEMPGSKSYTNRALMLAALTDGPIEISKPLVSDDTEVMVDCLRKIGIKVLKKKNKFIVSGSIKDVINKKYELDCKISGTTIRFLTALCCLVPGEKILKGQEGLNKRPVRDLVEVLKQFEVKIEYIKKKGFPPIKIYGQIQLRKGKRVIEMKGGVSSQYLSAILMIAPQLGKVVVKILDKQISKPYIEMTIDLMSQFGVSVLSNNYKKYIVQGEQKYKKNQYVVEGDYSSAGYFLAIAALTKSRITLTNLNPNSKQGDRKFIDILKKMGNEFKLEEDKITISGRGIKAIKVDMEDCPDQIQTLAVLVSFAKGVTRIRGISSLRVKETDRIIAIQNELSKMGIKTEVFEDELLIYGGNPKSAEINTYNDHRMAMSFAVAGTVLEGMVINNPGVVTKTFSTYWEKLKEIGVNTNEV